MQSLKAPAQVDPVVPRHTRRVAQIGDQLLEAPAGT